MKVALVPGHGPSLDRGAVNAASGTTELDWNRDLIQRIAFHLGDQVENVIIARTIERVPPVPAVNASLADFAIEFHCNAANTHASGTEMIYLSAAGKRLAEALQVRAVAALGLPDRGVKKPFNGRGGYFLSKTRMAAVIAESMFIDNDHDLRIANEHKDDLAQAYADAILSFRT